MSGALTITAADGIKVVTDDSTASYTDKGIYFNNQQVAAVQELFGEKHLTLFDNFVKLSSYQKIYRVGIPVDVGSFTKIYFDMQNRSYQSVSGIVFARHNMYAIRFGTNSSGQIVYADLKPLTIDDASTTLSYSGTIATYTTVTWDVFEMIFTCSNAPQPYPKITYERV